MKTSLILSITFIILGGVQLSAQKIERWNSNYKYDGEIYNKKELVNVFARDTALVALYESGLKSQKTANTVGFISLGMFTTSTILIITNDNYEFNEYVLWGIVIGLAATVPGTVGIVAQSSASKKKKQAIRMFNEQYDVGQSQIDFEIEMGKTKHGLGIIMKF